MRLCKWYLFPSTLLDMILKTHIASDGRPESESAPGCSPPVCSLATSYSYYHAELTFSLNCSRRSQWPRGLRRRSTAARLLRSWVRIGPGAWMSVVSVVCCQVEVSETSWPLVQRSPTDCGASLCVIQETYLWGAKHQSTVMELKIGDISLDVSPACH